MVECHGVKEGDTSYIAKGYEPIRPLNEGYADVEPIRRRVSSKSNRNNGEAIAKRINLVSLPQSYRKRLPCGYCSR